MIAALAKRFLTEPDPRIAGRFAVTMGWHGNRAIARFQHQARQGGRTPAFLFISITDTCNLHCRGCWATTTGKASSRSLTGAELDRIITEFKTVTRTRFFGLLGGEPLLHPELEAVIAGHPDCFFQVMTNGMLLDDERAARLRRLGNVTPLISIEGDAEESDRRRGSTDVFRRAMAAVDACRRQRLITGVATSVTGTNIDTLISDEFVRALIARGVLYYWTYIYRPVGPDPAPELALDEAGIIRLRRFLVETRKRLPILLVDAYWDANGRAICPAAEGLSYHIGPGGDIEPCPPLQFSCENIRDGRALNELFRDSAFLDGFRRLAARYGRGCILLERPDALLRFVNACGAKDTSGRGTARAELAAMQSRPSHDLRGNEIPEAQRVYRMAKRRFFLGFGTYG